MARRARCCALDVVVGRVVCDGAFFGPASGLEYFLSVARFSCEAKLLLVLGRFVGGAARRDGRPWHEVRRLEEAQAQDVIAHVCRIFGQTSGDNPSTPTSRVDQPLVPPSASFLYR